MNILALTRYGRQGASSRMRFLQYVPHLRQAGINVTVCPLFSDRYVAQVQNSRRDAVEVIRAFWHRAHALRSAGSFDLLWIEKEALPWLPDWLERMLVRGGVRYVLDYDDAVFHHYDQHRHLLARWALAGKHPSLMRRAALVVVGNRYLAQCATRFGAHRVAILPTAVDLGRYPRTSELTNARSDLPLVGWIGQRATADFLLPLAPAFSRLAASGCARFLAIGINAAAYGLPMESVEWSEDSEVASLRRLDVGIMPLPDRPFERGKCGYKLIQYMACSLPVVASPVGVNCELVAHGVNGLLASTVSEWEEALRAILADSAMRRSMGAAGRSLVEQAFCVQATAPALARLLNDAA